jgi:hypothetical protein
MKLFSDCSGSCETCKINYIGGCLAGHGDDDYVYASPEWIEEFKQQLENKNTDSKKGVCYEKHKDNY